MKKISFCLKDTNTYDVLAMELRECGYDNHQTHEFLDRFFRYCEYVDLELDLETQEIRVIEQG